MNYCNIHKSQMEQRFSKTKLDDNGQPKPYFAHMFEGNMCFGRPERQTKAPVATKPQVNTDSMLMCNAMNNAVAMVNAGTVGTDQLQSTYKKLLNILRNEPEF